VPAVFQAPIVKLFPASTVVPFVPPKSGAPASLSAVPFEPTTRIWMVPLSWLLLKVIVLPLLMVMEVGLKLLAPIVMVLEPLLLVLPVVVESPHAVSTEIATANRRSRATLFTEITPFQ
jgi:hypothetical protein